MLPLAALPLVALALSLAGCEACDTPTTHRLEEDLYEDDEQAAHVEEEAPSDPDEPAPPAIAPTPARASAPDPREPRPAPVAPALHADEDYASNEPVHARRYVYRVRMTVPAGLGSTRDRVTLPAAELFVDIAHERLRARFAGPGWPVPAGAEVRLRRDRPGVYLFDGEGGRPLEPGELASWFEGGPVSRRGPPLRVFGTYGFARGQAPANDEDVPGELMCALLAEWAAEDREGVLRRCELGAARLFRLGFWRAEQTAGVPVELPRSALRADERGRPAQISAETSRAFLEPEALARLGPEGPPEPTPAPGAPPEGLRVENHSATRVIVTVQGVALGWVDRGAEAWFVGLRPGTYDIGAIRPLGAVVQRGRAVSVPGLHRVCDGRCPREPAAPAP